MKDGEKKKLRRYVENDHGGCVKCLMGDVVDTMDGICCRMML